MKRQTPLILATVCVIVAACGNEQNNVTAELDAGIDQDAGVEPYEPPPRELISDTVWGTVQRLSPPRAPTPEDTTNAYADDPAAQRLGQYLFFEPAISGNGAVSCASCHLPERAFTDVGPLPTGGVTAPDRVPDKRTPTLVNVGFRKWFFWNGRVDTLWGQALHPYESPIEMAGSRLQLVHYIYDTADVRRAYEAIFGALPDRASIDPFPPRGRPFEEPQSEEERALDEAWRSLDEEDQRVINQITANVMKTIAAYQMQLVSFNAPFDRFVQQVREAPDDPSQWDAISPEAQEGMRLFVEVGGCLECHKGPHLADDKFHNIGVPSRDWSSPMDPGREAGLPLARVDIFSSMGEFSDDPEGDRANLLRVLPVDRGDLGAFQTPSLRNLNDRGPYMHAGQIETLEEVMEFYNEPPEDFPEIGKRDGEVDPLQLEPLQLSYFVEFLRSLQGEPIADELKEKPSSPDL